MSNKDETWFAVEDLDIKPIKLDSSAPDNMTCKLSDGTIIDFVYTEDVGVFIGSEKDIVVLF